MAEHNAIFGGEHSAHYYFRDFWGADTGMLAALHVLSLLGRTGRYDVRAGGRAAEGFRGLRRVELDGRRTPMRSWTGSQPLSPVAVAPTMTTGLRSKVTAGG